ncbi:MAG: copper resistance protein B [Vicinamibacterales bacterium]
MRRATGLRVSAHVLVAVAALAQPWAARAQTSAPPAGAPQVTAPPAGTPTGPPKAAPPTTHDHGAAQGGQGAPVPPITEADRRAAFPDVSEHGMQDGAIHSFVLGDRLEWRGGRTGGVGWEQRGWIGGDLNRVWFRSEGEATDGALDAAEAHLLFGRAIGRWWDVVGGLRQDWRPGSPQTWAAFGLQGLAPYWFEVEATGYVGADFRTALRLEAEYELRLTNRAVLQSRLEVDAYGRDDPARGIGAGLSRVESGLRLRYEFRRELAPYAGLTWERRLFGTADLARAAGDHTGGARAVVGLRWWF